MESPHPNLSTIINFYGLLDYFAGFMRGRLAMKSRNKL